MTEAATTDSAEAAETIEQIGARIFAEDAPAIPADAAAPTEVLAAEPPKDPVAERASARIIANERAERRAAKMRAELAAEKAAVEAGRGEVTGLLEAKAFAQEQGLDVADLRKLIQLAIDVKAAKASPSKAIELMELTPKAFFETLAKEHEPDAIARREVAKALTETEKRMQARIDALETERAEDKRQAEALQKQARMREVAAEEHEAGKGFVEFIASNADKYPNLVEAMLPHEFVQAGFAMLHAPLRDAKGQPIKDSRGKVITVLDQYQADHDGAPPSDEEIAETLDKQAAPRVQARSEWRARIGKNAPTASQATPSVDVRATQMDRGPSPRTLTSRAASEKAAAAPAWSQEAADEESLRIIRAAFKAG